MSVHAVSWILLETRQSTLQLDLRQAPYRAADCARMKALGAQRDDNGVRTTLGGMKFGSHTKLYEAQPHLLGKVINKVCGAIYILRQGNLSRLKYQILCVCVHQASIFMLLLHGTREEPHSHNVYG